MTKNNICIAIDAMGGDFGPSITVPASALALSQNHRLSICLVGDESQLHEVLAKQGLQGHPRIIVQHASEQIAMDESPAVTLRTKKDSSMRVALNLVKTKTAAACVSSGNTGALMATARFVLKTIPGVDRPAIISSLPTYEPGKYTQVVDLGANVDSSPEHLYQFAVMASVYTHIVFGIARPRIGLLNVGIEDIKGNELVKATGELLLRNQKHTNYVGYVEGDDIFKGSVDIVVCDGFVGNIVLKSTEGIARMMNKWLIKEYSANIMSQIAGLISLPVLRRVRRHMDPSAYDGASFLGLQGIVLKSHGGATIKGFSCAIQKAYEQAERNTPLLISHSIASALQREAEIES